MWNLLGVSLAERGKYKKAVEAYRNAVFYDKSNYVYCWNLGMALYNLPKPVCFVRIIHIEVK